MKIIVTGAAGFIGMHVSKFLLEAGHIVTGIDNLNPYYDQRLKQDRLNTLSKFDNFTFFK
ncbi:NAD-dependent epimerase/dehydratase family protein, partial [Alphaproteobacteria bacterium]|nr:NAD-dependent epimerase/dehydratase family protein [Alphaproteobacteria bacterium]